jgi:curved DNA-binding protein CbpA
MTQTITDPYAVLGVPRGATEQQVRLAYRRLAKRYHPDLHPGSRDSERMRRINEAWEALSSPARRARYDAETMQRAYTSSGHWTASARSSATGNTASGGGGTAWQAPSMARPDSQAWRPDHQEDDGPRWPSIVLGVAASLVLAIALFGGLLPFPLFGLILLIFVRGIFARFD